MKFGPVVDSAAGIVVAPPTGQRRDGGGGEGSRTLSVEGPLQRMKAAYQLVTTGTVDNTWFGPGTPMPPVAPESIQGRQFDTPVNYNPLIQTKSEGVSFASLRYFAYAAEIVRILIENRIATIASMAWSIQPINARQPGPKPALPAAALQLEAFFKYPDLEHDWGTWLGMWLEDSYVIDAPTLYIHRTNGGDLHALRPIDGATVKRIIDPHGWTPAPPNPAYQQILKGVPALSYTTDEMIYAMRRPGTYRIYGLSRVEQILVMIRLWMYREASNLEYYDKGSVPDGFIEGGANYTAAQLKELQDMLDTALSGQMGERRKLKVIPAGSKYTASKEPALKNDYDDTLIRIACFCFGTSPTPFVKQTNRATGEVQKESAGEEGVASDMQWIKAQLNNIIQRRLGYTDLEFMWQDKEAVDPIERAQVDAIYLDRGVSTPDEVRGDLGREPLPDGAGAKPRMQTTETELSNGAQPPTGNENTDPKGGTKQGPKTETTETSKAVTRPMLIKHAHAKPLAKMAPREFPPAQEQQRKLLAGTFTATLDELRASVMTQMGAILSGAQKLAKASTDDDSRVTNTWTPEDVAASLNLDAFTLAWDDTNNALVATAQDGAQTVVAKLTVDNPKPEAIIGRANADAVTWAQEHAAELLGKDGSDGLLAGTTRDMLRRTLADGLARGLTADELAAELMDDYAFSDARALLIAETEIAMANSHGQLAGYVAAGLTEKRWLLSNDEGVCVVCESNAKKGWIPIGDRFPGNVQAPLQHPNCRCAITARHQEAEE